MNERIQELFKRAGGSVSIHNLMSNPMQQREYREIWNENIDRFAELIVGECMRMCDVAAIGYESHGHMKEANGCYSAKEYIKEHFGVEE